MSLYRLYVPSFTSHEGFICNPLRPQIQATGFLVLRLDLKAASCEIVALNQSPALELLSAHL